MSLVDVPLKLGLYPHRINNQCLTYQRVNHNVQSGTEKSIVLFSSHISTDARYQGSKVGTTIRVGMRGRVEGRQLLAWTLY
jgi:hypothetical protein